ncbi:hypothetical protein ASC82_23925 [Streptomyces sp. Root431]|uniref:DUF2690 domain-containing protein n=1 Tax=Streptomyces sp. Root431 TaxID=1736535 RepID=UPI0007009705|nr:DUF2690 domain-containing protein [Streptomyces sp. Root431]KQX10703.1 hypothetical protein ASC82_23925 [Streptomyces sp. Root431]
MRPLTRKIVTLGGAAALTATGILGVASPASAATSCYAAGCNGKDPGTTVCQNDARTVATGWTGVELRYSPTCRAVWARKTNQSNGSTVNVHNTDGDYAWTSVPAWSKGWTTMVNDAGITAQAMETMDGGGVATTDWY